EVVFFIKDGYCLPMCDTAKNVSDIDESTIKLFGNGSEYKLYTDDGFTTDININKIKVINK
ncbi:MAG: hypothetical protein IKB73_03150, partial [Ruminococcus sp.]|nr:hypothetical protein [Ruminococcus sp.]